MTPKCTDTAQKDTDTRDSGDRTGHGYVPFSETASGRAQSVNGTPPAVSGKGGNVTDSVYSVYIA
jgi:hypothetical protein